MFKIKKIIFFGLLGLSLVFLSMSPVFAQDDGGLETGEVSAQLQAIAGEQGAAFGEAEDPRMLVADIINIALSLLGVFFLSYTFYAGFVWMLSGGDEEKIKKSQKTIKFAIIGFVIVLLSYSIAIFIEAKMNIVNRTTPFGGGGFFQVEWGTQKEASDYYPGRDPLGESAFVPGYESVWGPSGGNYSKKF